MHALTLPWRNVTGRPLRSILTMLGVAIALAGFIAMTGLTRGLQHSLESGLGELGADLIIAQRGGFTLGESTLPDDLGPRLTMIPGVESSAATLLNIMTADDAANVIAFGWPDGSFLWRNARVVHGRLPGPAERGVVVLGEALASLLKRSIGDEIELRFKSYRIIGIAHFESVLNQNGVFFALPELQALLSRAGQVTLYQVRLHRPLDPVHVTEIRTRLSEAVPGAAVQESSELANDLRLLRLVRAIAATLSLVVVGLAALGVGNTILMAVNERTYDIGVLSAIGWSKRRIVLSILSEGVTISVVGAVIGIGLGIAAMAGASVSPMAAGFLHPYINSQMVAEALVLALMIGVFGALYPAWRAAKLRPAEALRHL